MHQWLIENGKPDLAASVIYEQSLKMAAHAGLSENFMGTKQQAKFVGHGLGIEINEYPIFTPRSKDFLQTGMVFAYEPKFVLPGIGALGIENTYLVTENGIENLTVLEEDILLLPPRDCPKSLSSRAF
jgi:Xaa-Pro aminopeptidase